MISMTAQLPLAQWDHMRGWDGGWMWLWGSLMMLSWVVIIGGAAWLLLRSGRRGEEPSSARRILDERFARGELTLDEYEHHRDALR